MKIAAAKAAHYGIPLATVLTDSTHGQMSHFELITLQLDSDDGETGLGYVYTVGMGGGAIHSLLERDLIPFLIDADPRDIDGLWERMWWRLHYVGRGGLAAFAISAVDIALWDLRARQSGEPLWQSLGGLSDRVAVYAGGIDLQFTLEALLAQANTFIERGFRAIKMKVGRDSLAEDVARVAAMRDLLGADFPLMVDANMRWSVDEAIRAAQALSGYGLYWLEEPTLPEDVAGHARIAREGGLPIAAGENLHTLYEFEQMVAHGGVAYPEPDCANIGGITAWMKVAQLAHDHHLPVTSHGVHDLHVHLLAAAPNASYLEAHGFGLEAYIEHPLEIAEGYATAPSRPGHGVSFSWAALELHRVT